MRFLALRSLNSRRSAVTMAFNRYGTDKDRENLPLVIGHGLFGQKHNWNSIAKALQKRLGNQIFAIDFRNHGDSPHTSTHKYAEMAEDLAEFIDKVVFLESVFDRVHLLGHSMGGKVVAEVAANEKYQGMLEKVIVEDVSPAASTKDPSSTKKPMVFRSYLEAMKSANLQQTRKEIGLELAKSVTDVPTREFILTNLIYDEANPGAMKWKLNIETLEREIDHIILYGISSGSFRGKTFFLAGGNSNYLREKDQPEILKYFPNATFQSIPNAGHWIHAEQPAIFIDAIVKFLQE